jgi:hypothetical protein
MHGFSRLILLLIVLAWFAPAIAPAVSRVETIRLIPLSNEHHVSVEIRVSDASREQALAAARQRAVLDSVARIYLTDQLTLAEDLLLKYLNNYGDRFVDGIEVEEESFSAGEHHLTLSVFVNFENLVKDLEEKRFLYRPAPRPRFVAFMEETRDGVQNNEGIGRDALSSAVNARGLRRNRTPLPAPNQAGNLMSDASALERARIEAQRAGVEVLVTGSAETTFVEERKVYLENFYFFRATMDVNLVRVDSGEVLFTARSVATAGQSNQQDAIRLALERAAQTAAEELLSTFGEYWPVVVQDQADFHIMVSGASERQVELVIDSLQRQHPGLKAFKRKRFGTTSVVSVVFEGGADALVSALQSGSYPSVALVRQPAGKTVEIQVLG